MTILNEVIQFFKDYKRAKLIRRTGKLIPEQAVDFKFNGLNDKVNPSVGKVSSHTSVIKTPADVDKFYDSYTDEKINDIHSRGKLTPAEKVAEWEKFDLCAPGDAIGSAVDRCNYFGNMYCSSERCYRCIREFATNKEEYDKIDFKLVKDKIKMKEISLNA